MGGKAEKGTPKYIANKIKAKGLQKLRWYCQMCQKQCRDENGFKCHTMSESHQRQLLLFADNANKYIDEFSKEFADGYLELLHRQFGTKRVNANKVYQEYISHRDHLHMNATQWETLTEFVKWLGREGKCVVDETEKGWFVAYIDRDPAAIAALESKAKKEKMDKDDQERMLDFIQKQVERGKKQSSEEGEPSYSEFKRESSQEKVVLSLKRKAEDKKSEPLPVSALKIKLKEDSFKKQKIVEDSKSKQSALDDIMKMQERAKEKANSYFGKNTMSESQQQARKRGANYTQEERCLLLDLITQFKDIVECKNTGGWFLKKKRAAWHAITIKYNNNCSSGKRKTDQLKSLYDNMKQKSRKTGKGESNKVVYIDTEHEDRMETEDDPACALKIVKDDEIEMIKTGDGFWKPKLSNNDAKVLAIIQDQVDPLHNPYDSDSASSFFKETVTQDNDDINIKQDNASTSCSPTEMMTEKAEKYQDSEPIIEEVYESPIPKIKERRTCGKIIKKNKAPRQKKIVKYTSAEALKRLYFKKKCQNVDLERKKLMMEILYQKREHILRLKILKIKLDNVNVDIGET